MDKVFWIVLALLAGAFLPIQAGLNAKLDKVVESPIYASMFSFLVGTIGLLAYILFTRQTVVWSAIREVPNYVWIGGFMGAFYVTVIILAFPKLGPGLTFGLVVAGQMVISVLMEHFNVLVAQQHPISYMKVLGIILIVAGTIIIREY